MSYVAKLADNLVLIAMDSADYDDNIDYESPETSGEFSDETLTWILDQIDTYVADGYQVIGMMHHGIVEHHPSQSDYFSEYLVDDFESISEAFIEHGMHVVLTGHYHAQDIAVHSTDDGDLYDVMTGSLVTYPTPYRSIEWADNSFTVSSDAITEVDYDLGDYDNFEDYAYDYLIEGLSGQVAEYAAAAMDDDGDVTDEEAAAASALVSTELNTLLTTDPATDDEATISDLLADAFAVFYQGEDDDLFTGASASSIGNTYNVISDLSDSDNYESAYSDYASYYMLTGLFATMMWGESFSYYDTDYEFMYPDDNEFVISLD